MEVFQGSRVDYEQGLTIGMVIVFIYAVMGGMKGITYTQIAQYVIMIIAYTIPAIFISFMLTGNPIPQLGLGSTMEDGTYLLDKLDQIVTDLDLKNIHQQTTKLIEYVFLHIVTDDRNSRSATCYNAIFHSSFRKSC